MRGELLDESLQVLQRFLTGNVVDTAAAAICPSRRRDSGQRRCRTRSRSGPRCGGRNRKPLARAAGLQGCFPIFADAGLTSRRRRRWPS